MLKPIIITLVSLFLLAWLIPAISYLNLATLIVASIVLTILMAVVRPALKILFLPINVITLGLFGWVINVAILWLLLLIVPGFHIDPIVIFAYHLGWLMTLIVVSFLLSVIRSLADVLL